MCRRLISILVLICSFYCSQGQLNLNPDSNNIQVNDPSVLPAKLYGQLANAIKPSSFLSASQNDGKTLQVIAGNANDPAGIAKDLASLAGYIKPDLFKSSFNVAGFRSGASAVTTSGQIAGMLKNFESGIKPAALLGIWKMQKSAWTNDINNLK